MEEGEDMMSEKEEENVGMSWDGHTAVLELSKLEVKKGVKMEVILREEKIKDTRWESPSYFKTVWVKEGKVISVKEHGQVRVAFICKITDEEKKESVSETANIKVMKITTSAIPNVIKQLENLDLIKPHIISALMGQDFSNSIKV